MGFRSSDTFLAWMTIVMLVFIFTVPQALRKTMRYKPPEWIGVAEKLAAQIETKGAASIKDPPLCEKNGKPFVITSDESYWNVCCITEHNKNPSVPRCRGPEGWIGPTEKKDSMSAGNWKAEFQENGDLVIQYKYRAWTKYIYYFFGGLFILLIPYSIWDREYLAALISPLCVAMRA